MTFVELFNLTMAASILTPIVIGFVWLRLVPDEKLDERLEEVE